MLSCDMVEKVCYTRVAKKWEFFFGGTANEVVLVFVMMFSI